VRRRAPLPDRVLQALADGGWLGVAIPEEYGGAGLGITEAVHLTLFGMNPLVKHGSVELRQELLPRIRSGDGNAVETGCRSIQRQGGIGRRGPARLSSPAATVDGRPR
jgi:alkylation response protein AidB-like acyl-CoA dehydrogenase